MTPASHSRYAPPKSAGSARIWPCRSTAHSPRDITTRSPARRPHGAQSRVTVHQTAPAMPFVMPRLVLRFGLYSGLLRTIGTSPGQRQGVRTVRADVAALLLPHRYVRIAVAALVMALYLGSCATQPTPDAFDPPGFLLGVAHGFTMWFSLIGSIFTDIRIYAFPNAGGWYDFGYALGAGMILGGGSAAR